MKLILTFILLLICSKMTIAQYYPTLSELSGNGPTADNKGYYYEFKGNEVWNGLHSPSVHTSPGFEPFDYMASANYDFTLDSLNHQLHLSMNGSQGANEVFCLKFTKGNGMLMGAEVDYSLPIHRQIRARIKSSVRIDSFAIIPAFNKAGYFVLGDGIGYQKKTIFPNQWDTVVFDMVFTTWDNQVLDPKTGTGLAFYARNTLAPHPVGEILVDWIQVGSAMSFANNNPNYLVMDLNTYFQTFNAGASDQCVNGINFNNMSGVSTDLSTVPNSLYVTFDAPSSVEQLLQILFTGPNCGLEYLSLTDASQAKGKIKFTPQTDIPNIGFALLGNDQYGVLTESPITQYYQLTANKTDSIELSFDLGNILPTQIRGFVIKVNDPKANLRTSAVQYKLAIDEIAVGKAVKLTSINSTNLNLSTVNFGPNPVKEKLYFNTQLPKVSIYSVYGELIASYRDVEYVDMQNFENGVYLLTYQFNNVSTTERIVVHK